MKNPEVTIITPCFNENQTVISFLTELEHVLSPVHNRFSVIVVDDASTDNTLDLLRNFSFHSENLSLTILSLKFNVGHQGAIYQGLLFARDLDCDRFIIMDSDGEDDPEAIKELIRVKDYEIVNVVRGSRKESIFFRMSYVIYRLIFRMITQHNLNFGNYCMITKKVVLISVHTSFIHFAAHLSRQKLRTTGIVSNRRRRLDGVSKMNLVSLIHHAIKSMVEYAEELIMIFLKLFFFIGTVFMVMIGIVLYKKLFTDEAILGWASTFSATLFSMALISLGFFVIGILLLNMMSRRSNLQLGIFEEVKQ